MQKEIIQGKNNIESLNNQIQQLQDKQREKQQLEADLEANQRRLNNMKQRGAEEVKQ